MGWKPVRKAHLRSPKAQASLGLEEAPALHPGPDPVLSVPQQDTGSRGSSSGRERLIVEPPLPQEKAGGPAIPSHLLSTPYPFGISPSSVVQDSRFPPLK